ncbi:MAG: hypothetical protein DRO88_10760, partial [Promethearchaeia archaeon]
MDATGDHNEGENLSNADELLKFPARSFQLDQNQLLEELEHILGVDLLKQEFSNYDHIPIFQISTKQINKTTQLMLNLGYQLEGIFGADGNANIELFYMYSQGEFRQNSEIIIYVSIDKKIEHSSIQSLIPPSKYYEMNIFHRLGLNFIPQNHVSDISQSIMHVPLEFESQKIKHAPYLRGIFDQIHQKYHYHLISRNPKSGLIRSVSLQTGWKYKKIQPKLENASKIIDFLSILQEVSPFSNVHLTLGFLLNLEKIKGIDIVNKVSHIRTLLAELERIRSHLIWFANLSALLNLNIFAHRFKNVIGKIEKLNEKYFGHPYLFNTISLGSVKDLPTDEAQNYWKQITEISQKIHSLLHKFTNLNTVYVYLRKIGKISDSNALLWGLTGPSLRASSVLIDTRKSNPYLSYLQGSVAQSWEIVGSSQGDSFARCMVRRYEIEQSLKIILGLLKGLSNYMLQVPPTQSLEGLFPPNQTVISSIEAPQG